MIENNEVLMHIKFPCSYVFLLLDVLEHLGVNIDNELLLKEENITHQQLMQPEVYLSGMVLNRIINKAILIANEPALAVYVGRWMKLSGHGFLGLAALTAKDNRAAIRLAEQFVALRSEALKIRLEEKDTQAVIYFEDSLPIGDMKNFIIIALVMGFLSMGQEATGINLTGKLYFTIAKPNWFERFKNLFPKETYFQQNTTKLVLDRNLLDIPMVMADQVSSSLALQQCEKAWQKLFPTSKFLIQVELLMKDDLGRLKTLEQMASNLYMSPRTFKRKLALNGTSYSELQNRYLQQQAIKLLENNKLTLENIADTLGYSDVANFSRAFRRWFGVSPGRWRRTSQFSS